MKPWGKKRIEKKYGEIGVIVLQAYRAEEDRIKNWGNRLPSKKDLYCLAVRWLKRWKKEGKRFGLNGDIMKMSNSLCQEFVRRSFWPFHVATGLVTKSAIEFIARRINLGISEIIDGVDCGVDTEESSAN